MAKIDHPWTAPVRVEEIPDAGRRVHIAADESVRTRVAEAAGVNGLTRLEATFDLTRHGRGGLHVVGGISATVRQTCVVTLDPVVNEVAEPVDLVFVPAGTGTTGAAEVPLDADAPEPIVDGVVDLGAVATEFLILGVDPYPRKPGAAFEPPSNTDRGDTPFAALAAFKKNDGGTER